MRYLMLWILMLPLAAAAAAPQSNLPAPEIRDLYILPELRGEKVDLKVRWTTPTPTRGRVALADGRLVVEEDPSCLRGSTNARDRGEGWANNHRATLAGVPGKGPWRIRITATDPQGRATERVATATMEPPAQKGEEGKIALRILGYGPERRGEVAATGIPFPKGRSLMRHGCARAQDGRLVPVQADVWSRWPGDGSIKWILAALPAPGPEVTLEYGAPAVAPETPLRVSESPDAITLIRGARLVVPGARVAGGSSAARSAAPASRLRAGGCRGPPLAGPYPPRGGGKRPHRRCGRWFGWMASTPRRDRQDRATHSLCGSTRVLAPPVSASSTPSRTIMSRKR